MKTETFSPNIERKALRFEASSFELALFIPLSEISLYLGRDLLIWFILRPFLLEPSSESECSWDSIHSESYIRFEGGFPNGSPYIPKISASEL